MKKFKSILALTASVLALSAFAAPVSAFADDTRIDQYSQTNSANLGVETSTPETYTVTIPASTVNFDSNEDRERTVNVSDVLLEDNRQLTVTVNTTKGDNSNFQMANYTGSGADRTYNNNKITYTVLKGIDPIAPGATIVTVPYDNLGDAGTAMGSNTVLTFELPVGTTYPVAGNYADIMTFTIAVSAIS